MSNPLYNKASSPRPTGGKKPGPDRKAGGRGSVTEKTASWPGLPGKAGPNRSAGTPKAKVYPKSEGL